MLGEDYLFEVILDPAANQRLKKINTPQGSLLIHREGGCIGSAQLLKGIAFPRQGQGWSCKLRASQSRKARGVETPRSGKATTQAVAGRSGDWLDESRRDRCHGRCRQRGRAGRRSRPGRQGRGGRLQTGAWIPLRESSCSRAMRAAAALAEPAPMPPWIGRRFWMWMHGLRQRGSSCQGLLRPCAKRCYAGRRGRGTWSEVRERRE